MHKNYIAGEWIAADNAIENRNPSDITDLIGTYAQADTGQLDRALDSARAAQKQWQATGLEARQTALMQIGNALMARADELGELLSREEGKPRAEGRGEVYRAGQFFTYYAAEVLRQIGDNADSVRPGIEIDVRRDPVGIVAVISPWNFPTATAVWKIAPALAFGNAVIWKPANLVPASAVAVTEIIAGAGLPAGLFNLVMGSGATIGDALVSHPAVNAITFTGSVETGRRIAAAAIGNMPRMQMEMGSKNALVVMDDTDLDLAVGCAVNGAFGGTGQKCTASSRLIVHDAVHDAFVEKLVAATRALTVGTRWRMARRSARLSARASLPRTWIMSRWQKARAARSCAAATASIWRMTVSIWRPALSPAPAMTGGSTARRCSPPSPVSSAPAPMTRRWRCRMTRISA